MQLGHVEALARLESHDHGVFCTLHNERGIDAVPAVYAVADSNGTAFVAIPVDIVKAKSSTRLQRERNVEQNPRATLLVEHWDNGDWSALWWVRAHLQHEPHTDLRELFIDLLVQKYPQYTDQSFASILVFRVVALRGWSAVSPTNSAQESSVQERSAQEDLGHGHAPQESRDAG